MASSAFWNSTLMVLLYLSSGLEMTSASILLKLHGLEDGSFDPKDFEVAKPEGSEHKSPTADKRQSTTGTCTCTCETKPISNTTSTSASSSSSTEWTAETSAAETSARKQPHPPPEMVASSLRTDTSGRHQGSSSSSSASAAGGGDASDAGKLKMRTQMEDAADDKDDDEEDNGDEEDEGGDSNKIIDADITDNLQSDWGHGSRFLWKRLPDRMCYREPCLSDKDCCLWYNLCDRSAKVCVDCWYGSPCTSERDCCIRYPYCELEEDRGIGGLQQLQLKQGGKKRSSYAGQCVDQIS